MHDQYVSHFGCGMNDLRVQTLRFRVDIYAECMAFLQVITKNTKRVWVLHQAETSKVYTSSAQLKQELKDCSQAKQNKFSSKLLAVQAMHKPLLVQKQQVVPVYGPNLDLVLFLTNFLPLFTCIYLIQLL